MKRIINTVVTCYVALVVLILTLRRLGIDGLLARFAGTSLLVLIPAMTIYDAIRPKRVSCGDQHTQIIIVIRRR